jgi:hypothetical protein
VTFAPKGDSQEPETQAVVYESTSSSVALRGEDVRQARIRLDKSSITGSVGDVVEIAGDVVDWDTLNPLPNVKVTLRDRDDVYNLTTNDVGQFSFVVFLRQGAYDVWIEFPRQEVQVPV